MIRVWVLLALFAGLCGAQDRHDWKSVAGLAAGDKVRITLKTGKPFTGSFRSWTPDGVTVEARTIQRDDVKKVERQRSGGRWKHVAIGAAIGFGGGFAIGAAAGGCRPNEILCFGRGKTGAAVGAVGLVVGAAIGAALPAHRRQILYEKP